MASFAFKVEGIEPKDDPLWRLAVPAVRQAFWRAVVGFTLKVKDQELAAGLDRFGEPLTPIAASTAKKGRWRSYTGLGSAGNPPLVPAQVLSRTRALLTGRALANAAEIFWTFDPISGLPWGKVLSWHRAGSRHLPVRDVIGLSPDSLKQVQSQADLWWKVYKTLHPVFEPQMKVTTFKATIAIPQVGRFDLEHATFGVGASKELIEAAHKAGTATGFRQLPERPKAKAAMGPTQPKPVTPKPTPPKPTPPKVAAKAAAEAAAKAKAAAEAKAVARAAAEARAKAAAEARAKVVAEAKAKAATEAKAAKVAALRAAAEAEAKRIAREDAAISAQIQERQSAHATSVRYHGMATPEKMHSIEIEGIRYHFPPLTGGTGLDPDFGFAVDPILNQIKSLSEAPKIPSGIARHTKDVYLTTQKNTSDEYWEETYHSPGFTSAATGGYEKIVIYQGRSLDPGRFVHEMGHNLAHGVYGDVLPPKQSAYQAAIDSGEPPVSPYARLSPAEDFAEAVRLYYLERSGLAAIAPKRYAALEEMIHAPAS